MQLGNTIVTIRYLLHSRACAMPTYVLLVGCNGVLRETAVRLIGMAPHRMVAVPDLEAALRTLSGIQFDMLVLGDVPCDANFAGFLGAARSLQPALRVVDAKMHAGRAEPDFLNRKATPRWLASSLLTVRDAV